MNEENILDLGVEKSMSVNKRAKSAFNVISNWSKFISIFGLIIAGGILLFNLGIIILVIFTREGGIHPNKIWSAFFEIFYGVLYVLPFVYLLRFSNKLKASINSNNEEAFAVGLNYLKKAYRLLGLIVIFSTIVFLFALVVYGPAKVGF